MDDSQIPRREFQIEDPERRRFFGKIGILCGSIAGLIVGIPAVSFLLGLRKAPRNWRVLAISVGPLTLIPAF